jgi:SNF2 family DNA or RNA helicase
VLLRGGLTPAQQDAVERRFQSGEARLLIGQQQAAGVGRNFQAGSLVVYYSQRYSIVDREQSEDRTHRSGSEIHEKITYIDLLAKGTIDEDVVRGLAEKRTVQEVVVDMKRRLRGW